MKALVTGASGFVGQYLCTRLGREGIEPIGFTGEIRDYEQVRTAIDEVCPDLVFHLAAQAYVSEGNKDPLRSVEVNIKGTVNIIEAIHNTGTKARVLTAGTAEEYGYIQDGPEVNEDSPTLPTTPYGVSKLAAGAYALILGHQYKIPVVHTRAYTHTGPGQHPRYAVPAFARRVLFDEVIRHGNLSAVRNYTDVRDVVSAYLQVIHEPSGIYNVCSDNNINMKFILDKLVELSGRVNAEFYLDKSLYHEEVIDFVPPSYAKLHAQTGWEPKISIEETLTDVLGYWREAK